MNRIVVFAFLLAFGQNILAQKSFVCKDKTYQTDKDVWIEEETKSCFNRFQVYKPTEIPKEYLKRVNKIKTSFNKTAGGLLKKIELKEVKILREEKSCNNVFYVFRYHIIIDDKMYYRFSMTYDEKGKQLCENKIPAIKDKKKTYEFSSVCDAIHSARISTEFNEPISLVSVEYNAKYNTFVYVLRGKTRTKNSVQTRIDKRHKNRNMETLKYKVFLVDALTGRFLAIGEREHTRIKGLD